MEEQEQTSQEDGTLEPIEEQIPLATPPSHKKLVIGVVIAFVLVVGSISTYLLFQPKSQTVDDFFPPVDISGEWVRAVFPSDYNHAVEIWHPSDWTLNCCSDKDTSSDHYIYPLENKDNESKSIVVTDYSLVHPSKGSLDSLVYVSQNEFIELLRQKWLPNVNELEKVKLNNFESEAYVFQALGGGQENPLYPEIQFYARDTVQPSREIYLVNTGNSVISVVFRNYEQFDRALITEFLNRLEPVSYGVDTFSKFINSQSSIDIAEWKTYRNEEYGFEFNYPSSAIYPFLSREPPLNLSILSNDSDEVQGGLNRECVDSVLISHKWYAGKIGFVGISVCVQNEKNTIEEIIENVKTGSRESYELININGREAVFVEYGGILWGAYVMIPLQEDTLRIQHHQDAINRDLFKIIISTIKFI